MWNACARSGAASQGRGRSQYLLERVDDAAVVQLYADGFAALPVKEKTLIWHLYQAAIAGRDIFYDQRYAHTLEMRDVLEAIVTHKAAVDPATFAAIERYTKLFWINSGPYNNLTARKFVLTCTPEAFVAAAQAAQKAGASFPTAKGRNARPAAARAPEADVLRSERRPDGDEQDAAARAGHPRRRAPTTCTSASR